MLDSDNYSPIDTIDQLYYLSLFLGGELSETLFAYALCECNYNVADAEDVLQEACIRFSRQTKPVTCVRHAQSLMQSFIKKKAIDLYKAERCLKRGGNETIESLGNQTVPSTSNAMNALEINDALSILPENLREIIQLRFEGYTVTEVADKIGVSKRTVERQCTLIRHHAQQCLDLPIYVCC